MYPQFILRNSLTSKEGVRLEVVNIRLVERSRIGVRNSFCPGQCSAAPQSSPSCRWSIIATLSLWNNPKAPPRSQLPHVGPDHRIQKLWERGSSQRQLPGPGFSLTRPGTSGFLLPVTYEFGQNGLAACTIVSCERGRGPTQDRRLQGVLRG